MKENSIEEDIKIVENYLANSAINEIDSNFFKNGGWETVDLEIPKSMQHILSDYKRVLKENEELKEEKINNYKMIALAQNEALGYMQGYEDGKNSRTSAIASIVENQQYYIIKKQMEKYEEHIAKLQKENEEFKRLHIQDNKHLDFIMQHSIPIQKVKDKIEELDEELEIMKVDNKYGRYKEYGGKSKWERLFLTKYGMHDALQELLEGRK